MWPSSSVVLAELVGEFLGDSTYSESPSLSPELAANMTASSVLVANMCVAAGPSLGSARFEFLLLIMVAAGVAVSESAFWVSVWDVWEAPALAGKAGHPDPSVWTGGVKSRAHG